MSLFVKKTHIKPQLFDLDTSAKLYAYVRTHTWNQVFRVSATLAQPIDPEKLSWAILNIRSRFPTFYVRLCQKYSWKKLRSAGDSMIMYEDTGKICRPFDTSSVEDGEKPMFRVIYNDCTIIVEFFHSITDGSGGICYLKTLLAAYLERCGHKIEPGNGVLDYHEHYKEEEIENSFLKYYDKKGERAGRKEVLAYQYEPENTSDELNLCNLTFSVDELKAAARALGASATEFLAGVYAYSFILTRPEDETETDEQDDLNAEQAEAENEEKVEKNKRLPVKIQIPVNVRKLFPSETLRNFSLYTNITLYEKKDECTLKSVLEDLQPQFKNGISKQELQKTINLNVANEIMPVLNVVPSFVKRPVIRIGNKLYGERLFTSPLSNLGVVAVPEDMKPFVKDFGFVIGPTILNKVFATCCSYDGHVTLTIALMSNDMTIPETINQILKENGINVQTQFVQG